MKAQIFIILALCLLITSCMFRGFSQPFRMTVSVVDMDGKALKGRTVKIYRSISSFHGELYNAVADSWAVTDANGQAVLNYSLNISDSSQDFAVVTADDDDVYKCVNIVMHSLDNKKHATIKKTGTVQMDSLVPLKMRFKTERTDVQGVSVGVYNDPFLYSQQDFNTISRIFQKEFIKTTTPKLDTIITTKVFSKAKFILWNYMSFTKDPVSISTGLTIFTSASDRNSVFVQTF